MPVPQNLIDAVNEYQEQWRHPRLPPLANISELYSLFPDETPSTTGWPGPWPNAGSHGVYFVFYADGSLCYVGKASHSHIASRLSAHFGGSAKTGCRIISPGWNGRPTFIATLPMEHAFEAPALEEFLIAKLKPSENIHGNRPPQEP